MLFAMLLQTGILLAIIISVRSWAWLEDFLAALAIPRETKQRSEVFLDFAVGREGKGVSAAVAGLLHIQAEDHEASRSEKYKA